jgi:hypothetical protein
MTERQPQESNEASLSAVSAGGGDTVHGHGSHSSTVTITTETASSRGQPSPPPCIITLYGIVVDATVWQTSHPGGAVVLQRYHGRDATQAFEQAGHSDAARSLLVGLQIEDDDDASCQRSAAALTDTATTPPASRRPTTLFVLFSLFAWWQRRSSSADLVQVETTASSHKHPPPPYPIPAMTAPLPAVATAKLWPPQTATWHMDNTNDHNDIITGTTTMTTTALGEQTATPWWDEEDANLNDLI